MELGKKGRQTIQVGLSSQPPLWSAGESLKVSVESMSQSYPNYNLNYTH